MSKDDSSKNATSHILEESENPEFVVDIIISSDNTQTLKIFRGEDWAEKCW